MSISHRIYFTRVLHRRLVPVDYRFSYRVFSLLLDLDELPEGRVKSVTLGTETLCLTHFNGTYAALDNKCPHQGGPLGEGSIENGLLRCPWHGWDYHPCTGKAPGYDDGVVWRATKYGVAGVNTGAPPAAWTPPNPSRT